MWYIVDMILVIGLTLAAAGTFAGLLTLPRWFARSLGQDRIWRLRDRFIKEILVDEVLPKDHRAVRQLVREMEWALRDGKHFTLLHVYLTDRTLRQLDQEKLKMLVKNWGPQSLVGLDTQQRERLLHSRETFEMLFTGSLLLGSWFGLLQVARVLPRALMHQWASTKTEAEARHISLRRVEDEIREGASRAADKAAVETPFGRRLSEWIQDVKVSSFPTRREQELAVQANAGQLVA